MKLSSCSIPCALFAALLSGCQGPSPERSVLDFGTGSGTGVALGLFGYVDEGIGPYLAMHGDLREGSGTNYDGVLDSGGFPGDEKTGETTRPVGLSAGMTYRIHEYVGVSAGAALTILKTYNNFFDPTLSLDSSGHYNVEGEEEVLTGMELGAHLLLSENYALGIRHDLGADFTLFTFGFSY